ncbi:hypothetical protein BSKO_03400 [Bryopsis sp. KO-2023]|nr:hypothetical protein BSKO_03400 [Bryopsis sp. KO-2023]
MSSDDSPGEKSQAKASNAENVEDNRRRRPTRPSSQDSNGSSPPGPPKKKQKTLKNQEKTEEEPLLRATKEICRPGAPAETERQELEYPDRYSPPPRLDDEAGYYTYVCGENLSPRYKILSKLGEGTFGMVLECWDRITKDYVAAKVIRNIDKYRRAAMIELEVLNTLEKNDTEGKRHCISLQRWFDYRGHVCMVFDRLGPSLFDFLQINGYRPFDISKVQQFGQQIFEAVAYMHELSLIHTDLKPENILLEKNGYKRCSSSPASSVGARSAKRVPISSNVKVIDFGSATFNESYHSHIVSTRHYRAPEIILGHGWSFPCDIWSVGTILVELITGETLFHTHENLEHLAMMEQVLGPIPESMSKKCNRQTEKYFVRGRLNWPEGAQSRKNIRSVRSLLKLKALIHELGDKSVRPHLDLFLDLVGKMLCYEPSKRITAREALKHEFFKTPICGNTWPTEA